MSQLLSSAAIAALACCALVPVIETLAVRMKIVALPNPLVPSHVRPTPLLGGIAILVASLPGIAWTIGLAPRWRLLLVGVIVIGLLGVYKDVRARALSPWLQLLVQAGAVSALLVHGKGFEGVDNPFLDRVIVLGLSLWIINGWNFLDVMDGLAAGVAMVTALVFALLGLRENDTTLVVLSGTVAGSTGAFLLFNRPPARIFMGDAGSFGIGFLICAVVLAGSGTGYDGWTLGLMLFLPLCEVAATATMRVVAGRSPVLGGGEHLPLRLLRAGWRPRSIVLAACLITATLGLVGVAMRQ